MVSPDGSRIAFARSQDIWVMNADGSGQTQLTGTEGSGEQSPAWSPDGTRIVFVRASAAGGGTTGPELWIMDDDGSDVRQSTDTTGAASLAPAWLPAAEVIAFHSNVAAGGYDIYTIAADATPERAPTRACGARATSSATRTRPWSPDGARIAFERGNGTNVGDTTKELWAMDADGTDAVALTTNGVYDADPALVAGRHADRVREPRRRRLGDPIDARRRRRRRERHEHDLRHRRRPARLGRCIGDAASAAPASAAPSPASTPAALGHGAAGARLRRQGRLRSRPGARLPHP